MEIRVAVTSHHPHSPTRSHRDGRPLCLSGRHLAPASPETHEAPPAPPYSNLEVGEAREKRGKPHLHRLTGVRAKKDGDFCRCNLLSASLTCGRSSACQSGGAPHLAVETRPGLALQSRLERRSCTLPAPRPPRLRAFPRVRDLWRAPKAS